MSTDEHAKTDWELECIALSEFTAYVDWKYMCIPQLAGLLGDNVDTCVLLVTRSVTKFVFIRDVNVMWCNVVELI